MVEEEINPIYENIDQPEANLIYEEEIIPVPDETTSEPEIEEEDFTGVLYDVEEVKLQEQQPKPEVKPSDDLGLNSLVRQDDDLEDFEIENEVDSDVYSLDELKLKKLSPTHI